MDEAGVTVSAITCRGEKFCLLLLAFAFVLWPSYVCFSFWICVVAFEFGSILQRHHVLAFTNSVFRVLVLEIVVDWRVLPGIYRTTRSDEHILYQSKLKWSTYLYLKLIGANQNYVYSKYQLMEPASHLFNINSWFIPLCFEVNIDRIMLPVATIECQICVLRFGTFCLGADMMHSRTFLKWRARLGSCVFFRMLLFPHCICI